MMADESPDYKQLYLEAQRQLQEDKIRNEATEIAPTATEKALEETYRIHKATEVAPEAQTQDQRRWEKMQEKLRKTTLLEFLDGSHTHLHLGLSIQAGALLSAHGNPADTDNKFRPERLRVWDDFPVRQEAIWNDIMGSGFTMERHFTSMLTLESSDELFQCKTLRSEFDLHYFQTITVEGPLASIIRHMYNNQILRRNYRLQGSMGFKSHADTMSPGAYLEDVMEKLSISGDGPQRLPVRASHPHSHQFCVYNTGIRDVENRVAAFIIEHKAPYKLPLSYIYEGLGDMDLEDVLLYREPESSKDYFRRLIAAVITQVFSYMVRSGLEYGCVCTGEAYIFLRVPDDPRTVYYFLSVPKGDVDVITRWSSKSDNSNHLHLTAIGQMLAFTLQAFNAPPRSQEWRNDAVTQLNSWEVMYEYLLDSMPGGDELLSEYRPFRHNEFLQVSPDRLQSILSPVAITDHWLPQDQHKSSGEPDESTPSHQLPEQQPSHIQSTASSSSPDRNIHSTRDTRREAQQGPYCTQNCLLGLVNGSSLDLSCPNVQDHGKDHHPINLATFLLLTCQQLSEDLDTNCKPMGIPGACGILFQVRLQPYGYTIAAKATSIYFIHRLRWEATVYEHLRPIQGIHVPVYLGNIDLKVPYFYEGITELVHMMLLSFGGKPISHCINENRDLVCQQLDISTQALHNLGILHKDLEPRNMLWNEETGKVTIIDFDRAKIVEAQPQPVLGQTSHDLNEKGKPGACTTKQTHDNISLFTREQQSAAFLLRKLK